MNQRTLLAVVGTIVLLVAGGAVAVWRMGHRPSDQPKPHEARADYDAMVSRLGGDEPAVRAELNFLASTASAERDAADHDRANALTRECLDPNVLLDISDVRVFVGAASRGEPAAFHFVSKAHGKRLREIAGDDPSPERVLRVRANLANLADEFELIRLPPDWSVKIEGEKVAMPFLDLLRAAHEFLPAGQHPESILEPRIPAFAGGEGRLLDQLDLYFNGRRHGPRSRPQSSPNFTATGASLPSRRHFRNTSRKFRRGFARRRRSSSPRVIPSELRPSTTFMPNSTGSLPR